MEIINDNAVMLSNYEVLHLLQDIQAGRNGQEKPNKFQQNLATINYSTLKFLEKTTAKDQTPEIVTSFMKKLEPYKLEKAEKLQLLNQRPTSAVEIQLLIEESEERMTEQQIEELLDVIATTLPGEEPPAAEPEPEPEAEPIDQ